MEYSFNVEIAKKYGINEAIILKNLSFWILKNKANKKHFHEGFYWTYNTAKAFTELFPFWSERQIYSILKKLEDNKLIKTANYNKIGYDRTKWYTIIDTSILPNGQMEVTKPSNRITENVEPIPDIKPNGKADIKTDTNIYILKNELLDLWNNSILGKIPKITQIPSDRFKKYTLRVKAGMNFRAVLEMIKKSDFLQGKNKDGWVVTFDWIMENDKNWLKIIEGNYNNKQIKEEQTGKGW